MNLSPKDNSKPVTGNSELTTENSTPSGVFTDSPPSFLKSWQALYAIVLAELGVLIILFYLFMKAFE